jgi:hypothetical protein
MLTIKNEFYFKQVNIFAKNKIILTKIEIIYFKVKLAETRLKTGV